LRGIERVWERLVKRIVRFWISGMNCMRTGRRVQHDLHGMGGVNGDMLRTVVLFKHDPDVSEKRQ
jgi:hypothetical protein